MEALCADCHTPSLSRRVPACSDYHLYRLTCCSKYVCWDYCRYTCTCAAVNRVTLHDAVDFYYDGFICYACQQINPVKIEYHGDARLQCARYCTSACYLEPVYLPGRPELAAQELLVRRVLTPDIIAWMRAYFADELSDLSDLSDIHIILNGLTLEEEPMEEVPKLMEAQEPMEVQAQEPMEVQALEALYDAYVAFKQTKG